MLPKIAVLGGSSPFTLGLIDAIEHAQPAIPAAHLALQGRSTAALEAIERYAKLRLGPSGWQASSTTDLDQAIDGAAIIVHQIRYGGLEGRADDERIATEFGMPADETLGPGALQAALRSAPALRDLAERVARLAPDAWLLNLTNPLSVATALLAERVGAKCIGLCELPWHTVVEACRLLNVPPEQATWHYAGLNHRGFIYHLSLANRDLIAALAELPETTIIGGGTPSTIRELGAIPLKYFRLMLGGKSIVAGRVAKLTELRERILAELAEDPGRSPPSLGQRSMEWYPLSVVPVIGAILRDDGGRHVINALDGPIVSEFPVDIKRSGWRCVPQQAPSGESERWIEAFARHEIAVMRAVQEPTHTNLSLAIEFDPLKPAADPGTIAERLLANIQTAEPRETIR